MAASTASTSSANDQITRTEGAPAHELARHAIDAILEKKGRDIVVMNMYHVSGVADFFVLCTAGSDIQVKAIVDGVREHIREQAQENAWHMEGYEHRQWVLLDYVSVVVHVYNQEKREFYNLERLWGDAASEAVPDEAEDASAVKLLQTPAAEQEPAA
jgi:ribosome-associated protein